MSTQRPPTPPPAEPSSGPAALRLFTAVTLPDEVRAAAFEAATPLVARLPGVKRVAEANLHVTLRFLGDTPHDALPRLREALAEAAAAVRAGRVRVAGFGAFPDVRRPRVVWAGVDDPAGVLAAAEGAVGERVAPLGFRGESRPYTAHVTVARVDTHTPEWRRRGPFDTLTFPPKAPFGPEFAVSDLVLFRSELTPRGALHHVVERFPLAPS
jgi:RNA 2',3'-cyclic 3'-phosphodiesterase